MINQELLSLLKKYWIAGVFLLAILIVLIMFVLSLVNNSPNKSTNNNSALSGSQKIPKNDSSGQILLPRAIQDHPQSVVYNFNFTGSLPTSTGVFAKPALASDQGSLNHLASGFGLSGSATEIDGVFYWSSTAGDSFLNFDPKDGFINYNNNALQPKPNSESGIPIVKTQDQISQAARTILKKYGVQEDDTDFSQPLIKYMITYSESPTYTDDFNRANYFLVTFPRAVQGIKLYKQFGETINTSVVFDRLYNARQLNYYFLRVVDQNKRIPLLSIGQLKDAVIAGKGTIRQPFSSTSNLASLTLNNATLGYLFDSSSPYLVPIFVLTGNGQQNDGSSVQNAVVYVLASN